MNRVLLALLLATLAAAQPQLQEPLTRPKPGLGLLPVAPPQHADGLVVVQVSDAQSRPLAGVLVVLHGSMSSERPQPTSRHGSTDAAGRVRFAGLPNGSYWAGARIAGHDVAPTSTTNVQLDGPKAEGQMQFVMRRRPVLTGRVVDERGTPLLEAQVQAFRLVGSDLDRRLEVVEIATTDDRGIYRLSLNDAGRYWVMALHMEPSFPRGSAPRSTGIVFSPNSPDLLSAMPTDLTFDQPEIALDIALPPAPRTEIAAGVLSGPDGRPCTRCRYSLQRVEGPYRYELTSGITGRDAGFDTRGVPPGQYRIYVEDQGTNPGWWAIEEATLAEGKTTGLTIYTRPPVAVSGRVILEDLPAEVREASREKADAVVVEAGDVGNRFFNVQDGSLGRAELPLERGEFTLGPMPPERYRFEVLVQGAESYVAGIKRSGRDLTSPLVDFSQPGAWTDLEIRVRFDMARPQFRLGAGSMPPAPTPFLDTSTVGMDGAEYRLMLVPDPDETPFGRMSQGHCVPDGSCYGPPVPPGRYWAIAFHSRHQLEVDLSNPEVRARLEPWGREVRLGPGEGPMVTLSVAPDKAFRGGE